MQPFVPYHYSKGFLWDNLESARSALGLSKADVAASLGINSKQYAVATNARPNMKLSNAFYYAVAVGLTLDEAIRGVEESCFLRYLKHHKIDFASLPVDSIIRMYPYKALIATFDSFISVCPDYRLRTVICNCMAMDKANLMQFFYGPTGVEEDFNLLFNSMSVADPVDLFCQNGLTRELRRFGTKQNFAERIGLTLGQLSRYLNYTENREKNTSYKRIETVPLLDKVLDICNCIEVNLDQMLKPLFVIDDFIDLRLKDAVDDSDKMYYFRVSFDYFSSVFRALPVLNPIVNRYCAATEDVRKHFFELSQKKRLISTFFPMRNR